MSLQLAAQHLASKGRGPDTTLVHMAPGEVAGLQALAKAHGGALTINPDTGLYEAGFLSKILPMIAGAALTATGIGAPMAALLVGGGTGLATGSLKKGLMAGLGAFGGAGLGAGLAGAGAAGMNAAATEGILAANPGLTAGEIAREMGTTGFVQPTLAASANPATASFLDKSMAGIKGLGTEAGRSAFMNQIGGTSGLTKYGAAAAAPILMGGEPGEGYKGTGPNYEYTYDPTSGSYTRVPTGTRDKQPSTPPMFMPQPATTTPMPKMAVGGPVDEMSARNEYETLMANGGQMYAGGGMSHLGDYSDGGRLLRGPGDGVSDDIPAVIADKQPARLADGEFVVPARIVSELGNGSTDAGARKLYAMMDRVQRSRSKTVGKDKVAVNNRAEKYLPA